ncbi:hypothetical protein C1645_822448 [Glomus cerebriforme]|uniref:GATA-type domain-containing protein n=1 Tax=Glomus cerebriforme TaxID=658196 RepID=A0A397T7Q1_9GLOM|nr:hypothetical protein C1645_822448 [Glomus cerebriforme]
MSATDPKFPELSSPNSLSSNSPAQENGQFNETDSNYSGTSSTSDDENQKIVPTSLSLHKICNIIQKPSPAIKSQKLKKKSVSQDESNAMPDNVVSNNSKFNERTSTYEENFTCDKDFNERKNDESISPTDNVHYEENYEPRLSNQTNSQYATKPVYGQIFYQTKMLPVSSGVSIQCTNPLCSQCQFITTPHHINLPSTSSTSVASGTLPVPIQYYFSLANNDLYSSFVTPSSVYISPSSTPNYLPQKQQLKSEIPISPDNLTLYQPTTPSDTELNQAEYSDYTNQQSKKKRRRKTKITTNEPIDSYENEHTTNSGEIHRCSNCGARDSPAWRRDLRGEALLCNACGLYLKVKGRHRPTKIGADGEIRLAKPRRTSKQKCQNCDALEICWRGHKGEKLCDSCGLFLKQHGYNRP